MGWRKIREKASHLASEIWVFLKIKVSLSAPTNCHAPQDLVPIFISYTVSIVSGVVKDQEQKPSLK